LGDYLDEIISSCEQADIDYVLDYFAFPYVIDIFWAYRLIIHVYAYYRDTVFYSTGNINYALTSTGDNPMLYMGDGWSFQFDRIINNGADDVILKLGNGSAYMYRQGVSASNLKNYMLSDMKLKEITNDYKTSKYTLSFKDGKKEYFDAGGRLLGIKDRFNNTIDFTYNINPGYNGSIDITDTNGKITNITFSPTNVTVTLPDSNKVKYTLESRTKGKVIIQKLDQLNRLTAFTYSANVADFDNFSRNISSPAKSSIPYNLLTDVTYPSGAVSHYEYASAIIAVPKIKQSDL
jgi:hypothetical protein